MPAILMQLLTTVGPMLLAAAPSLIVPLITQIAPTLAPKAPVLAAAVAATTAVQTASAPSAAPGTPPNHPPPVPGSQPIAFLQEMLVNLGSPVDVDGQIGPQTIAALEESLGITITIIPGGIASTILSDLSKVA